jgi:hypothetical protein
LSEAAFAATEAPLAEAVAETRDPCTGALPLWQALDVSPTPAALRAFIDTQGGCEVLRLLAEARLAEALAEEAAALASVEAPAAQTETPAAVAAVEAPVVVETAPVTAPATRTERAARVIVFSQASEVHVMGSAQLTDEGMQAFQRQFSPATYFGAFAVSKDGGWGYYTGVNSRQAARDLALAECRAASQDCAIYAELLPANYVDPGPDAITMAPEVTRVYRDESTDLGFFAMAISADGAYSKMWDAETQEAADRLALEDCENYRSDAPAAAGMGCILLPPP